MKFKRLTLKIKLKFYDLAEIRGPTAPYRLKTNAKNVFSMLRLLNRFGTIPKPVIFRKFDLEIEDNDVEHFVRQTSFCQPVHNNISAKMALLFPRIYFRLVFMTDVRTNVRTFVLHNDITPYTVHYIGTM